MTSFLFSFLVAATPQAGSGLNTTSIVVALLTALGTMGAAFLMFRGKTQDTANWLIVELRNEAKAARQSANECEVHREEDRRVMEDLRSNIVSLEVGFRKMRDENNNLKVEVSKLKKELHHE